MDRTGTYNMVNRYTESLKRSSMTQKVNKLHKMCLLPFLKDLLSYEGRLRKFVTDKDKVFWQKFMSCCYAGLSFETSCPMSENIYIGFANSLPSGNAIKEQSKGYPQNAGYYVSGTVTGNYFWIAVPSGHSLFAVKNMSFNGDYIDISTFKRTNETISNAQYTLYYVKSLIPLRSNYQITIK